MLYILYRGNKNLSRASQQGNTYLFDILHIYQILPCNFVKFRQKCDYLRIFLMDDDCVALGFNMYCRFPFSEKYGKAAEDVDTLNKIIDDVSDIHILCWN